MGWITVYSTNHPHLVEVVKSILEDNSIQFVVVDKRDRMYKSILEPGIEVHVKSEDFIMGKKLISDIES